MEDGGTLGAHALALLKQLAEFAVSRGSFCSPDSRAPLTAPMQVSLWVQRWQHRLSTWLHMSPSLSSCCACTALMGLSLQCLARCSAYFSWPYLALSLLLCFYGSNFLL